MKEKLIKMKETQTTYPTESVLDFLDTYNQIAGQAPIIPLGTFKNKVSLSLKQEYLLHAEISGNKFRKLKYNLLEAKKTNQKTLLTFGGAYSNHIAAVASAGKLFNFKTIGIIRGEELAQKWKQNKTLSKAVTDGMKLHFISREHYRNKNNISFIKELQNRFRSFYLIPEGGTNKLAIKGCKEITAEIEENYNYICCPVGTGGTIAGIIEGSNKRQHLLGFSALKGGFLKKEIQKYTQKTNWKILENYHFGGYAKINSELLKFINNFETCHQIPLDSIYTAKMMYGIMNLINQSYFPKNSRILAIHTGGLQGNLSRKK